ncbi:transient receptor potential cation channel protein painless-like isoform X2 [Anoplophora glabripennis]|uniref:transient receptor potential cation channel protein painless-like isoform X2 n=1 Tax=Anoplophora glabripennis TaxID=217634 RepID=UPI0008735ED1|nr:transient receptor potential cation channel protein painless-like isoform X2 [Anoplophora glabripennis]
MAPASPFCRKREKELLKLIVGETGKGRYSFYESDIQSIRNIIEASKKFLTYQYWKDNKIRSILHIAKYSSKLRYDIKQMIINTIVDVGYRSFTFSENSSFSDKCYSLFFVAAKGDFKQLKKIVTYFRNNNLTKIHDTREGDTVISFMIKFGDHDQKEFLSCFKFMLDEGIDVERIDYYKNNVKEIIKKEVEFLEKNNIGDGFIDKLRNILDYVDKFAKRGENLDTIINYKYKIFQAIIKDDKSLKGFLKKELIDSDDGENTLLQLAIIKNNVEITKELLNAGADPNRIVEGGNEEEPLVLAAKLARDNIFKEILKNKNTKINKSMFIKFVKELKLKFLNSLLESKNLNVDIEYRGKTPLHYAIIGKNRKAVQSLLQRGSLVDDVCLQNINPKDLEDYLNSCIKSDNYKKDMEEGNYKSFLVFDFFINSCRKHHKTEKSYQHSDESARLYNSSSICSNRFDSEVAVIRNIGNIKRLKYLLEHPLVYIYIMLKWHCVLNYYYFFVIVKSIFYLIIDSLIYTDSFNLWILIPVILVQLLVVCYNYSEFKLEFRRYTLHFILEILIFLCLIIICCLKFINLANYNGVVGVINQISAFVIIFTSVSALLTVGYHLKLSKWMSMAKRVFKNFSILLLFFMIPISAFAASFNLLLPVNENSNTTESDNADFSSFSRALSRTLIMIGGDIGDKKFTGPGSYLLFLFFTIGIAIILLNFWTGVAVSDIKEIEEQSTIVAFKNVIVFIESAEIMYRFLYNIKFNTCLRGAFKYVQVPFIKPRVYLKKNNNFLFGIDFFINSQKQFRRNTHFEKCKIPINIISKIKSLSEEETDVNVEKALKELIDKTKSFDSIMAKLNKLEQLLQNQSNKNK